ncbi:hypothetical protein ACIRD0_37705 [Streptomyces microflavus]|uniref:hypothetical protein n=1 Tax=Streptomyces microflavus TaxID=1919 RepID=UPI00381F7C4E
MSTVAFLGGLLMSGCTSSGETASSVEASASGNDFEPSYMQQIMDSQLDRRVSELGEGVVHRPERKKPLEISPCRLVELPGGARITHEGAAKRKAVRVPALYELRSERYNPGFSVSIYLLPRQTDKAKLLAEVLTAARECGPRTAAAPASALSRSQAPITTSAHITAGKHGPGVAVLSDARYKAAPQPPGPDWTVGPDGKLARVSRPPASSSGPLTPKDTSLEYGQALAYGTNGRFLIEVLKVTESSPSDPTPAPGEQPSAATSSKAQEILSTLLTGFQGVPE